MSTTSELNLFVFASFCLFSFDVAMVADENQFQWSTMAWYCVSAIRYECHHSNWWTLCKVNTKRTAVTTSLWIHRKKYFLKFNSFLSFSLYLSLRSVHRKTLSSEIGELNVHFGVFIGGLGDFSESYLNSVDNFRGCMSDVISQKFI